MELGFEPRRWNHQFQQRQDSGSAARVGEPKEEHKKVGNGPQAELGVSFLVRRFCNR